MSTSVRELVSRVRWGHLHERRKVGLVRLWDVLSETSFHNKFWMNGGLLLGCIRTGEPLLHDDDADFSFWESDIDSMHDGLRALERNGFQMRPGHKNNDGTRTKWHLRYRGVKYEFYQMTRLDDCMQWICHARRPGLELLNQVPMHELDTFELYGRQWLKPDDHAEYLTALYGTWQTPDPDYCYWTDSKAVISTTPWNRSS